LYIEFLRPIVEGVEGPPRSLGQDDTRVYIEAINDGGGLTNLGGLSPIEEEAEVPSPSLNSPRAQQVSPSGDPLAELSKGASEGRNPKVEAIMYEGCESYRVCFDASSGSITYFFSDGFFLDSLTITFPEGSVSDSASSSSSVCQCELSYGSSSSSGNSSTITISRSSQGGPITVSLHGVTVVERLPLDTTVQLPPKSCTVNGLSAGDNVTWHARVDARGNHVTLHSRPRVGASVGGVHSKLSFRSCLAQLFFSGR